MTRICYDVEDLNSFEHAFPVNRTIETHQAGDETISNEIEVILCNFIFYALAEQCKMSIIVRCNRDSHGNCIHNFQWPLVPNMTCWSRSVSRKYLKIVESKKVVWKLRIFLEICVVNIKFWPLRLKPAEVEILRMFSLQKNLIFVKKIFVIRIFLIQRKCLSTWDA